MHSRRRCRAPELRDATWSAAEIRRTKEQRKRSIAFTAVTLILGDGRHTVAGIRDENAAGSVGKASRTKKKREARKR